VAGKCVLVTPSLIGIVQPTFVWVAAHLPPDIATAAALSSCDTSAAVVL
jgi:hypothetical protein